MKDEIERRRRVSVDATVAVMAQTAKDIHMERKHEKYQRLIARCKSLEPVACAVVHPCDESSLRAAVEAAQEGLIIPILVGPETKIRRVAAEAKPCELLVSSIVRDLAAGSSIEFEDRGVRTLKGVPGDWQLFAARLSDRAGLR